MSTGPEQSKLDSYLDDSRRESVEAAAVEWARVSGLLDHVRARLEHASSRAQELGGETGPAASRAFAKSATAMGKKAGQLRDGGDALSYAAGAIAFGIARRRELGKPEGRPSDPEPLQPGATDKEIAKHGQQQSRVSAWEEEQARRERVARETTTEMDTRFHRSTVTMKKIHGEPDPVPKPSGPAGSDPGGSTPYAPGGRTHQGPGSTGVHPTYDPSGHGDGFTPDEHHTTPHDYTPGTTGPTGGTPSGTTTPDGSAQGNGPGVPTIGGGTPGGGVPGGGSSTTTSVSSLGAGAGITGGAGLLGGAAMGGLGGNLGGLRGAVAPVSTSSATVRPIGSSARGATSGTLSRSSGRSATTVTGTGSGSGGSTVRSRGAAGGRGAAGSSGGGAGRGKGSKKSQRDHLEEEWEIDDEDVAPAVLD